MKLQSFTYLRWVLLLLVVLVACSRQSAPQTPAPSTEATNDVSDKRYRELVVGTWTDNYKGRRTLTIHSDGTATMLVELEGLNAKLYADKMTFEEEWSINQGRFKMKAIGGEPKARVQLILKTMGNVSDHEILELTDQRMLLLDANGETQYDWRRSSAN
jgi:hypothetical protein